MAHPYASKAKETHKAKTGNMGKSNNLDIPVMRAVGENSSKKIAISSASMQHKDQSAASGYKRGGHVGKHRSKPKVIVAAAPPVAPDPAMAAGAAPPPAPPPPGQPPMARGGRAYPKFGGAENGMGRKSLSAMQAKKK